MTEAQPTTLAEQPPAAPELDETMLGAQPQPDEEQNSARWQPDRIPVATYRLQFNRDWTFKDALKLVPYLHELGISDCYASPILLPREGSMHGYDIADPTQLNPALGTPADFDALCAALKEHGMGLLVDVVPNHMGINEQTNQWWMDVLENGPSSAYAHYFDIDWSPVKRELENKVLLPILEDQYGIALESGKLSLQFEDGAFVVYHYSLRLPIAPRTYQPLVEQAIALLSAEVDAEHEALLELQSILTAIGYLPSRMEQDPERLVERTREKEIIKRRLAAAYESYPEVHAAIDQTIDIYNGQIGQPESFDKLEALINAQPYRLSFWRVAAEEINYRRFFDINELAAIRIEEPDVFSATHALILDLVAQGQITGLRIDHPDGLWNPPDYFQQLQAAYRAARGGSGALYVVAEKILAQHEELPEGWLIAGTTGYDFLNMANGIFVDRRRRKTFDKIYDSFIGPHQPLDDLIIDKKKMIMRRALVSEMNALSHRLQRITEKNRRYRDFTLYGLTATLREVIACLDIYRTYITESREVSERDQYYVRRAVAEAKRRNPETAGALFDFIGDTLLLRNLDEFRPEDRDDVVEFVMKFQQITGPVMAKSVEDTAFYIDNRLVSLNEVGGHPEEFGTTVSMFHRHNSLMQREWPYTMLTTSTHDTKRSEDVRARINVLSELTDDWKTALRRWSRTNARFKVELDDDGAVAPDRNDEYLLYQTLLGTWPLGPLNTEQFAAYRERIVAYMQKATKEAKVHTSWVNANQAYDDAVRSFIERVLDRQRNRGFIHDFLRLQRRIAYYGHFNALSQVALKLTAPGVPDIYQGNELWDWSLVDPDNRRPVDYEQRQAALDALKHAHASPSLAQQLLEGIDTGWIKLFVTQRILQVRRHVAALFNRSDYQPLQAVGERERHVLAFLRQDEQHSMLVLVPRLVVGLTDGIEQPPLGEEVWGATQLELPEQLAGTTLFNIMTGATLAVPKQTPPTLPVAQLLQDFPVAVLVDLQTQRQLPEPTAPKPPRRRTQRAASTPQGDETLS